jgi:hypothetical protein
MIHLDTTHTVENDSKTNPIYKFKHSIRSAKSEPLARIHEMFDHTLPGGYDAVERCLSPRSGMVRNYIYDDFPGLRPYTLPCELSVDSRMVPYRRSWLEEFKADVKRNEGRTWWSVFCFLLSFDFFILINFHQVASPISVTLEYDSEEFWVVIKVVNAARICRSLNYPTVTTLPEFVGYVGHSENRW